MKDYRFFVRTGPVTALVSMDRADELVPLHDLFHPEYLNDGSSRYGVERHGNDFYLTARF